jgi:hypothetical protein
MWAGWGEIAGTARGAFMEAFGINVLRFAVYDLERIVGGAGDCVGVARYSCG